MKERKGKKLFVVGSKLEDFFYSSLKAAKDDVDAEEGQKVFEVEVKVVKRYIPKMWMEEEVR